MKMKMTSTRSLTAGQNAQLADIVVIFTSPVVWWRSMKTDKYKLGAITCAVICWLRAALRVIITMEEAHTHTQTGHQLQPGEG